MTATNNLKWLLLILVSSLSQQVDLMSDTDSVDILTGPSGVVRSRPESSGVVGSRDEGMLLEYRKIEDWRIAEKISKEWYRVINFLAY